MKSIVSFFIFTSRTFSMDYLIQTRLGRTLASRFEVTTSSFLASLVSYEFLKRIVDLLLASLVLMILSPLILVIAVCIKLTDFGPILFVQTRIGEDGIPFSCLKFRSMCVNADRMKEQLAQQNRHNDSRTFKIASDPRITWIGRWLRRSSLDELPQLWNVVRGEMSLVGPRPPCPQEVALYTAKDWKRLDVKPGLTCIWQVRGRGDIPFAGQVLMDVEYVENRCLLLDFKLLLLTVPAVLTARGAY